MEYSQFLEEVRESVAYKVGKQYKVQINHVIKNNEVELDGIVIFAEGEKISPNIYLNPYYEQSMNGKTIEMIAEEILHIYYINKDEKKIEDYQFEFSFEEQKNNIIYRIVNYQKNEKMLEKVPYVAFLDLAVTFHCLVKQDEEGIGTIRITKEIMNQWNVGIKDLLQLANKNTPILFPVRIRTMDEVIREILLKEVEELFGKYEVGEESVSPTVCHSREDMVNNVLAQFDKDKKIPMYIMTNIQGINGASTLLYHDAISSFANQVNSDFYVLPSSIHEVILVPYQEHMSKDSLRSMVCDVNQTQVPVDEILSDQVYIYRREKNSMEI